MLESLTNWLTDLLTVRFVCFCYYIINSSWSSLTWILLYWLLLACRLRAVCCWLRWCHPPRPWMNERPATLDEPLACAPLLISKHASERFRANKKLERYSLRLDHDGDIQNKFVSLDNLIVGCVTLLRCLRKVLSTLLEHQSFVVWKSSLICALDCGQ